MWASNPNLELLFARLEWPSLMVRERAATQIVALLKEPELREVTGEALLGWLSSRDLESLAANVLLIPLRLKADGVGVFPDVDRLTTGVRYPSILSHLLMAELYDQQTKPFRWKEGHSGPPPRGFTSSSYFDRYKTAFLPPFYEGRAESIENGYLTSFRRQWAYEWERILERTGLPESGPPYYFIGRRFDKAHVGIDVPQSEAYRSAFLRALAWGVDEGGLPEDTARPYALECCPIDIGIWQVQPSAKPTWWPIAPVPREGLDTAPGRIWSQVEALWEEQQRSTGELVIYAGGQIISTETTIYDLEIHGAFQRFEGGQEPALKDVADWLDQNHIIITDQITSTMSGRIPNESVNEYVRKFAGWSLAPAAFRVRTWTVPRWQADRMYRGVWMPAPYVINPENKLVSGNESLKLQIGKQTVARWQTWSDHLQERWFSDVPPGTGVCLWIDRGLIRDFCDATRSNFCWIVRVKLYHRRESSDNFESIDDFRAFGASSIFR